MLYAAISACPVYGGKLKSFDAAKVEDMPGVKKVVRSSDNAVAVVADTWWRAKTALAALPIEWDEGENAKVSSATIAAMLKEGLDADRGLRRQQGRRRQGRDRRRGQEGRGGLRLSLPEPRPDGADERDGAVDAGECEVWCGTQNGEAALAAAAEAAGLPVAKCDVYKIMLGGGFGRRGRADYVTPGRADRQGDAGHAGQAAVVARRGHDARLLSSDHAVQDDRRARRQRQPGRLHMRISGQSILASLAPESLENGMDPVTFQGLNAGGAEAAFGYNVPNLLIDHAMRNPHVPAGFWRGVNTNQNAIYMEMLHRRAGEGAGKDPLEFRLKMLKPKNAAVLKAVAEKAGYGKPAPAGRLPRPGAGHGLWQLCRGVRRGVGDRRHVKIHRIVGAHRSRPRRQPGADRAPGRGLVRLRPVGHALRREHRRGGPIEQTNFDSYKVMRMDEMPEVEAIVMPSGGFWGGVGEPTIAVAAPSVLNAIFEATGKRIRNFPLKNNDLSQA